MITPPDPLISDVESLGDGILVTFGDGRCAFYSAVLLQDVFTRAEEIHEPPADEPQE